MSDLKPLNRRLLFELMKNSRRSDRELAKVLKVSQPTITRKRTLIEKEFIDSFTAIPKWSKIGYTLFVVTTVKIKTNIASKEKYDAVRKRALSWLATQPNILMCAGSRGGGVDSLMISIHKDYSDFDKFIHNYKLELGDWIDDSQSIIVNLAGEEVTKNFTFRDLAVAETK
jgi:DNA-binding Lrp family transcriptional regulator